MNSNKGFRFAVIALAVAASYVAALSACSKRYQDLPVFSPIPIQDSVNYSVGRFKTSYLADQIHAYFHGNANGPIAITTFADLDNLYGSSTFGRFLAEQLMSELAMRGYNILEVRQSDAMQFLSDQGEFGLSRDVGSLKTAFQDVSGLIVGTYTVSPVNVFINARLIDPATSLIVSAGSVEMPKTAEIARMLRTSTLPPTLERIPVRHLGYAGYPAPYYWPTPSFQPFSQKLPGEQSEEIYRSEKPLGTDIPQPMLPKAKDLKNLSGAPITEPTT